VHQGGPAGVVDGFEDGGVEGDGVVDAVVFDIGGKDVGVVGITLVQLAALTPKRVKRLEKLTLFNFI